MNELHGNRFCLFFRERVYNKSELTFGGWERKRGAVCELISHIVHGDKTEFYGGDFIRDIKYVLTLDADTNLSVESVRDLLSIALHPVNRPVVKNNKVVSGYGIIQPTIRTELSSAYNTGFTRLISGSGGADSYSTASFHRSQALFGSGNFCGKGLIDVNLFQRLVSDKIPDGLVLSHDAVEGSLLRTLAVSDITLTDSTPGNTVSFFRRQHRWMRGDLQNLYFLKGNSISPFAKWRLLLTVFSHTLPFFSVISVLSGMMATESSGLLLFLLAYSYLLLPCAFSFFTRVISGVRFGAFRFFSKSCSMFTQTLSRLTFEISVSPRKAVLNLHAYFLAIVRLFTRQKTLEWTTAAQTERLSSGLGKYVLDGIPSVVAGVILLLFANPPFVRFCGVLYFIYPLLAVYLSKRLGGGVLAHPELDSNGKATLVSHAKDMIAFYLDNVNEKTNHLPPDNIQFSPTYSLAMRTSPTNIGFYLVSLLAGCDLGIIDTETLYTKLDKSLSVIENLEKYQGNLYNWYELSNLSVLGDEFVSTVDSGNLVVMLVALKEGLKEYSETEPRLNELIERVEKLIVETKLTALYDEKKKLFKIGVNPNNPESEIGCYDLLMSEARMTAYYSVATSTVSKKHWESLGRPLTQKRGYMGMLSWSGTAFEYLMPQLFLPLYRDSFAYESLAFALSVQRAKGTPWGISESGYYSFDSEMNYQYKANGIQSLALRRISKDEDIRSPYSTYLSLCMLGNTALKNLKAFESRGMYGKYGMYEALDFNNDSGGVCVKSYMAHHVGMSVIAILNAVKDNIFVKRFCSDLQIGSAVELLQEKIPVEAHIFEDGYHHPIKAQKPLKSFLASEKQTNNTLSVEMLSRGDLTALVSSKGHVSLNCGEKSVCNTVFNQNSLGLTLGVVFLKGDNAYGCAPLYGNGLNFGFERGETFVSHIASSRDFSARVKYSMLKNCNCFVVNTRGESLKKYDISLTFEPILDTTKNFLSHIAFSRLFIESEYDKTKRILYFHRRSRNDGTHIFTVAVATKDKDSSFSFRTSKEGLQIKKADSPLDYAFCPTDNEIGECINPFCLARCENTEGGRATFLITCGETKGECEKNIRLARKEKNEVNLPEYNEALEQLLPSLLYGRGLKVTDAFSNCTVNHLWAKSVSGDYPLVVARIERVARSRTEELLRAFLLLARGCIRCELIFIVSDEDKYNRPTESSLREVCAKLGADKYMGKKGGIFILQANELAQTFCDTLKRSAHFYVDFDRDFTLSSNNSQEIREIITDTNHNFPAVIPSDGIAAPKGYFLPEGFVVDKSNVFECPYSYILTGHRFSTVLTQNSLGYSFFDNAREGRICAFFGDTHYLENGERLLITLNDKNYDLCAVSSKVRFEKGFVVYEGEIEGTSFSVTVTVPSQYPVKLIKIQCAISASVSFSVKPVMGDSVLTVNGIEVVTFNKGVSSSILFRNPFGATFPDGVGFAGVCGGEASAEKGVLHGEGTEILFFLGACKTELGAKNLVSVINKGFFERALTDASGFAESLLTNIKIKTQNQAFDRFFNFFLPYQVSACRFLARGSFYQSGGAYGFRDQLQDCLTLVYSNPKAVRTHIIRCCAHQYDDGTVMHWWHTRNFNQINRGIKSKCSDDLLYLPWVTADYLEKTNDFSLLSVPVFYLSSPPLGNHAERYEQPQRSQLKETVYQHCKKVFIGGLKLGKHGLILMGSCDWNDAFSLIGEKGVGESIFSSLLYIVSAKSFIPICEKMGDSEFVDFLKEAIENLKNAVETNAFFGDRYARAICDDGSILGVEDSEECKIDILSQAFAVLAGLDRERAKIGLKTAFSRLYDKENQIFKLFSPPFANGKVRVGYIRGYVAGIRENGGQYSHGVLWGALACAKMGMIDEALKILNCVNPINRMENKGLSKKYKVEPYVISADIYHGKHGGRGGWSWYTGAASWYYKIMLEHIFGIKLGANQTLLSAKPLTEYEMEIIFGSARLTISASKDYEEAKLNGEHAEFPLTLQSGENKLELPL